jgi:hypothetical protein
MNWWLSFADSKFLGACIVPGLTMDEACAVAKRLGLHPGGEIAGVFIPYEQDRKIGPEWRNRLLTKTEAMEFIDKFSMGVRACPHDEHVEIRKDGA